MNTSVTHKLKMKKFLPYFLLLCISVQSFAQNLHIADMQCEYLANPLGVESLHPKLSWQITATGKNVLQTAYRIIVADNPATIQNNTGNVWDSKKTVSAASIQLVYEGKPLEPAKTYYWKVMVWDNQNNTSAWSNPAHWQMGLLNTWDWKEAKWIGYEAMPDSLRLQPETAEWKRAPRKDVLPLIRKNISVKTGLKKATVFIAGLGHFDLSINGKKTGDHFLDAGWTAYDKQALYVTFDITKQLKGGNNAVGVMLGNGFYFMPGNRYLKLQLAYGFPKMIGRILLEYANGTSESIVSDESWKTAPGPVTFSSIYGGEDYDATMEQAGWNTASFSDKNWKNVVVVDGPPALNAQITTPLKIFDQFSTVKITMPKPGIWVYDLGQNASGIPAIAVKGKRGDKIRLWPSELLDSTGLITTKPIGTPVYFEYTLKGNGTETWQPQFMYYGFRYVQVEGGIPPGKPNPDNLPVVLSMKGLHTRNAAVRAGEFHCSNEMFNKTDLLIDWAVRSNMSSVLTDCPHREKLGWMEEVHLVGPSIRYNYDIAPLCRKVINDIIAGQTAEGLLPATAPEYAQFGGPFRDSPEWGSNGIILPWYVYEWYGDKQILNDAYPMMQRYAAYLQFKLKDGILTHGLGDWYDIGPKEPGPSQLTQQGITPSAIFYYDLTILQKVASLLHKEKDADYYKALSEKVRAAYNKAFFNKEKMIYGKGSQTANAVSVYMNLVEPQYKDAVVDNIVKELKDNNNRLSAGDIGYRYLLRVLDDNNRSDVIYDMNSNASVPGYGYQLARGATSLTESWQAFTNSSNNHMMLGHIKEWFFSGLAGIRPAKGTVAFKEVDIRPQLVGDVTAAEGSYHSPYGMIRSNWKKTNNKFELNVEIPANTTATIYLPANSTSTIKEGGKEITNTMNGEKINYENGQVAMKVGSGNYRFVVE